VVVNNSIGTATSDPAVLAVLAPPLLSEPRLLPDGSFQARLQSSNTNRTHLIEISTNLPNWTSLTSIFYSNSPTLFIDATATNAPLRFYRARLGL